MCKSFNSAGKTAQHKSMNLQWCADNKTIEQLVEEDDDIIIGHG